MGNATATGPASGRIPGRTFAPNSVSVGADRVRGVHPSDALFPDESEEPTESTDAARRDAELHESQAIAAVRAAEDEHRAAALRSGLEHGQSCPVCAQVVTTLPPPLAAPGLATARANAEAARVKADAARTAAQSARARMTS